MPGPPELGDAPTMEIPVAVVLGAAGTLLSAVIAAFVSMHSNRATQEMALMRLQEDRDKRNADTGFNTMQGGINTLQGVVDRVSAERDRLYAEVDKKQAKIEQLQAQKDALEDEIRQKEEQELERRARCLRSGEPCREGSLPLTLPGVIRPKKAQAAEEEGDAPEGD